MKSPIHRIRHSLDSCFCSPSCLRFLVEFVTIETIKMKYPLVRKTDGNDPNHTIFSPILFLVRCACVCAYVAFSGNIRSIAITFEIILIFVALMGRHLVCIKWKDDEKYVSGYLSSSLSLSMPAAPLLPITPAQHLNLLPTTKANWPLNIYDLFS